MAHKTARHSLCVVTKLLFLVDECSGPVANRLVTSVVLFLKKYIPDLLMTSIAIECVMTFLLATAWAGGLIGDSFIVENT